MTNEEKNSSMLMTIAVLGGTGKEGAGLVLRWAQAGYNVVIGSRSAERAAQKADELNAQLDGGMITGMGNPEAAAKADIVVLTVPYAAQQATLEAVKDAVQGKILVDVTVPLAPPQVRTVHIPEGGSACRESQSFLGEGVRVVAAFQNVGADHLKDLNEPINLDVLVCGDDAEAKEDVIQLIDAISGMRGIDAGPMANAVAVEALTPVLLYINRRYKVTGAGIRITGLER